MTEYFDIAEMSCRDGTPYPDRWLLRWSRLRDGVLVPIREAWSAPIVIVSGYRSPEHNDRLREKSANVAQRSQHVLGRAADVRPGGQREPGDVDRLYDLIVRMHDAGRLPELGGLGRYRGWVHVDVRPRSVDAAIASWDARPAGDRVA